MGFFAKLFGKKDNAEDKMHMVFNRILVILNDDEKQNALMPPDMRRTILNRPALNTIPGATGAFGRSPENPIPVNGSLGEMTYLSRLVSKENGQHIFFHRLGSIIKNVSLPNMLDVFETVTWDGLRWDILYLDSYFRGKSHNAPQGYLFAKRVEGFTGIHSYLKSFPEGMYAATLRCARDILRAPIAHPHIQDIDVTDFQRPEHHLQHLHEVSARLSSRQ